jgi:hypothetical protein
MSAFHSPVWLQEETASGVMQKAGYPSSYKDPPGGVHLIVREVLRVEETHTCFSDKTIHIMFDYVLFDWHTTADVPFDISMVQRYYQRVPKCVSKRREMKPESVRQP